MMMADKYTILTLNCKGLRRTIKRRSIFQYLKAKRADIILLQETHIQDPDIGLWETEWEVGNILPNPGTPKSAGQIILTTKQFNILEHIIHEPGRLHEVLLQDHDIILRVINIYGHNSEPLRIPLLNTLFAALNVNKNNDFTCVGGDFNIPPSSLLDKQGGNKKRPASQIYLNNRISQARLVDTWRHENPTQKTFTWWQNSPVVRCRLDYFLVPTEFLHSVKETKITPSIKTDHKCVELKIAVAKSKRGPGVWKFNCTLLQNQKYVEDMRQLINKVWIEQSSENPATRFDFLKYKIRQKTKQFSKNLAKQNKLKEREIIHEIEELDKLEQNQGYLTETQNNTLQERNCQLENILEHKAKGA